VLALLNKRTSKLRKRESSKHNNFSLYTLHPQPSNHSPCSNVPPEYPTMIWHTTSTTLISTTMPHHPTSQHLSQLPYHSILYRHNLLTFLHHPRVYPRLRLSVPPIPFRPLSTIPQYPPIHHSQLEPWQHLHLQPHSSHLAVWHGLDYQPADNIPLFDNSTFSKPPVTEMFPSMGALIEAPVQVDSFVNDECDPIVPFAIP